MRIGSRIRVDSSRRDSAASTGTVTVRLRGEYDLFRRAEIAAAFAPLRTAAVAVVDLSAATYLDATFLGQLALLHREVKANRGELRLVGVNRHFRRLLEIAGFTNVLAIFPSAADPAAGSYLI